MISAIQRILFGGATDPTKERVLPGGESARDVLQEALLSLLECRQAESWEALGVRIAHAACNRCAATSDCGQAPARRVFGGA